MSESIAISVENVSKAYRIWESPSARLTTALMEGAARVLPGGDWLRRRAARSYRDFWALNDVSFTVRKGDSIGIIGRNGSGKSTLLQIIAGTLQPTSGSVQVRGRVAALLELGSGFNPEFTGRENVYLNGAVLGLSRAEVDARFDQIAAFADIGDFIDQPAKTYSSGMLMRLAFAVQTAVDPQILIVDEALSVGDFFFQQKCFQRIKELRDGGTTILFVSHDMGSVRDLCDQALYLRKGRVAVWGASQHAISNYFREGDAAAIVDVPMNDSGTAYAVSGDLERAIARSIWRPDTQEAPSDSPVQLLAVTVQDENDQSSLKFKLKQTAVFRGYFRARSAAEFHAALELKNRHGQVVSSLGTRVSGIAPGKAQPGQVWCFETRVGLGLEAGEYSFQFCLGLPHPKPNVGIRVAETPWLGPITINWDYTADPAPFLGMFDLPATTDLHEVR